MVCLLQAECRAGREAASDAGAATADLSILRQYDVEKPAMIDDLDWPIVFGVSAALATLVLCGSCVRDWWTATPQVTEVTIVDKSYTPGHYVQSCSTNAKGWTTCHED